MEGIFYIFFPDAVFLPYDHGLDIDISLLRENSIQSERIRFRNAERLVDGAEQWDAMIVSVVSSYDTYLGGQCLVRPTFPPFVQLGCGTSIVVYHVSGTHDGDYQST